MSKSPAILLAHILECIGWLDTYASEGSEHFMLDHRTQAAALRDLQTLGESVKALPKELLELHQEVDWRGIIGVRNILVHDYLGINMGIVWEVLQRDLPPLRAAVQDLLTRA